MGRRDFLKTAGALASASAGAAESRYQLACMTLPYRMYSLARALEGIRKAGYRYIAPYGTHSNQPVFTPALTSRERAELKRRFRDAELEPALGFAGMGPDIRTPEGLQQTMAELDLCADFGIRTAVGAGPWYFKKFPNIPKRAKDWQKECEAFYPAVERVVRHAESAGVTFTLKPHTGITANAKMCFDFAQRFPSPRFGICWDAGNVSFYEGIWPDPDLPELAPRVKAVCLKDHKGLRGEPNFPVPGSGQIDHEDMFRTLAGGGFRGPLAVERVDGTDRAPTMQAEVIDERLAAAYRYLAPLLEKTMRA